MTDTGGGQQTPEEGPSLVGGIEILRSLVTGRRSFVGLVGGLLVGTGIASADDHRPVSGYGAGGYGERGFGSNGATLERSVAYYADSDGIVRSSGVSAALEDWKGDLIGTDLLLEVINAQYDGEPVTGERE